MANIVTRSGKGSELSFAEVDSNFTGLASDTSTLLARVYAPVANIGAIPASPGNGDRIEISDSTGIRGLLNVQGIPSDFPSSGDISGLQVRLQYSSSLSAWQWVSYESKAPDGRYAPLVSPTLTGTPAAPTATAGTNTTQLATTAFVAAAVGPLAPTASPTFTGTVTIPAGASISGFAPLGSPQFTGTPAGPTAAAGTNTTQLATTAFVASYAVPVLGAQQSPTAGATNITFTGIPSWAKRVTLSWSGLTMASGYANLRLGTSSGLKTSGYGTAPSTNYTWLKSIGGGENIYNYTDLGVYYFVGIYTGSGNVSIVKMSSTAWMISGMCLMPGASYVIGYQAYQVLASDLTQIALVGDGSATFSAGGNINILYE